jgi:hypothetical protein
MSSNRRRRILVAAAALAALCFGVLGSGCGGGGGGNRATPPATAPQSASTQDGSSKTGSSKTGPNANQNAFNPSNFGDPATGANKFLPIKPGTQWVRQGFVNVGNRRLPHRVVTTVTDVSKEIDGVRTVIVLDQDFNGGQLAEQALDYVAEDKDGNVWYLGSYTESYEGGQFVNYSDAWLAGIQSSQPGILMLADPQTGTPPYSERTTPGVEPSGSQVVKTGQSQCVPFKCYKDVLVVEEGGSEYKYYAPGVGQIKTAPKTSGGKQEVEDLINLTQLSPSGLAQLSGEALKEDKNAQVQAPDVFGHAPAAKRTL